MTKREFVYSLRVVADAMQALDEQIAVVRSEWSEQARQFSRDATKYRSGEPNDRDGFAEQDVHTLLSELIDLQDTALRRRLALSLKVGMV